MSDCVWLVLGCVRFALGKSYIIPTSINKFVIVNRFVKVERKRDYKQYKIYFVIN